MKRLMVFLVLCIAWYGCESDDAKLQRLELDAASARLELLRAEQAVDSLRALGARRPPDGPHAVRSIDNDFAAWSDSLPALKRRVELAERDLLRFLR